MANGLKDVRLAAGYNNAKDAAAELGIPASSYSRFENYPDKIPSDKLWMLADFFGCTMDEVAGRVEPKPLGEAVEMQLRYEALSDESRAVLDGLLGYLESREAEAEARAREKALRQWESNAEYYEKLFLLSTEDDPKLRDLVVFGSAAEVREAFRSFMESRAEGMRAEREQTIYEDHLRAGWPEGEAAEKAREIAAEDADEDEFRVEQTVAAYCRNHRIEDRPDVEQAGEGASEAA